MLIHTEHHENCVYELYNGILHGKPIKENDFSATIGTCMKVCKYMWKV